MVEETALRLEQSIVSGEFAADQQLPPEGRLAEVLGVSRTVVREAMRILDAHGMVEVSQGRPAKVKPADPQNVSKALGTFLQRGGHPLLHLVEVRRPLEGEIAALAATRASAEQIAALIEANEQLVGLKSMDAQVEADVHFHNLLAESTGNPVFVLLLQTLVELTRYSRRETLAQTGVSVAAAEHREILEAVREKDPEGARQAMLRHLGRAEHDLRGDTESNRFRSRPASEGNCPNAAQSRPWSLNPGAFPMRRLLVDLSHPLEHGQLSFPNDPKPSVATYNTIAHDGYNLCQLSISSHQGTHLDAPYHFYDDGKTLDRIALDRFFGPAVLVDLAPGSWLPARTPITVEMLRAHEEAFQPGAKVIYRTGWDRTFGTPECFSDFPTLTREAAEWITSRRIHLLGMDTFSPSADWKEVHLTLLAPGVEIVILEGLTNLEQLPEQFTLVAFPLNIKGRDGSPVRAVAVVDQP